MPRMARAVIDGGTYHVLTRGNNRQVVFHHDADFQRYLQLLSAYSQEHELKIYHFVLMPNHVHLVLEVARGEALSKAMLGLNLAYSLFYRKRYRYSGHLWQGRFKSLLVNGNRSLLESGRYVELHPVRGGLVRSPKDYPWSSYRVYAEGAGHPFMARHPLYDTLGASSPERQARYRAFIEEGMRSSKPSRPSTRYGIIGEAAESLKQLRDRLGFPSREWTPGASEEV